jgi:hypothetical protein
VAIAGTGAKNGWSDRMNTVVASGAVPFKVAVHVVVVPAMTGFGLHVKPTTVASTEVRIAAFATPL